MKPHAGATGRWPDQANRSMTIPRRRFMQAMLGVIASTLGGYASTARAAKLGKVVVVGGGYGGATAAKYLALWSGGAVDVTLVEQDAAFVSCPMSNLVLGGSMQLADLTVGYDGLARRGITVVRDTAMAVDPDKRIVRLARGAALPYDRLVLSPGIDFLAGRVPGLDNADAQSKVLHAWKPGAQTADLRRQLESMRDGGVFAIVIPRAPYRCPPGPYERACQVAWYFKRAKPRAKVLILDGNEEVQSKKALFLKAWNEDYKGVVEYRPDCVLVDVDVATLTAKFETADDAKADVLNVIPPHRAGNIAAQAGVVRVRQGQRDPRARRCDPGRPADAEVGPHGEPARESRRRSDSRVPRRAADQPGAGVDQYLLQLHHGSQRRPYRVGASIRPCAEDVDHRAGLGRRVIGDERGGRGLRVRVGAEHLERHADVTL